MTTLLQASHQWASRPHDERYLSLLDMRNFMRQQRQSSSAKVISTRRLQAVPDESDPRRGLLIE
ncbi:MAG TPA: hypothetical protein VGU20_28740, partial [Stellaceae bacterium]|nr:hypothetical protein [Stellaceae bacterium]